MEWSWSIESRFQIISTKEPLTSGGGLLSVLDTVAHFGAFWAFWSFWAQIETPWVLWIFMIKTCPLQFSLF